MLYDQSPKLRVAASRGRWSPLVQHSLADKNALFSSLFLVGAVLRGDDDAAWKRRVLSVECTVLLPTRMPRPPARAHACLPGARLRSCHSAAPRRALCCTGCGVCTRCKTLTMRLRVKHPVRPPAPAHNLRLAQNPDSADAGNNGLYTEISYLDTAASQWRRAETPIGTEFDRGGQAREEGASSSFD
jgi:hypothetical protein